MHDRHINLYCINLSEENINTTFHQGQVYNTLLNPVNLFAYIDFLNQKK